METSQATETKQSNRSWRKYILEFLSIFIAVVSAFALNNWNENRRDNEAESKILSEILNGLEKDKEDVAVNIMGHRYGIKSCDFWRKIFDGEQPNLDTLENYYSVLTRDFISIQNRSGYETLKSKGFELIRNDTLREKIISLYEFDYQILEKLEEEYTEMKFYENYFEEFNEVLAPHFIYDDQANLSSMSLPLNIDDIKKKLLHSYLYKIKVNRKFILDFYEEVDVKIENLMEEIEDELNL